MTDNQPVPGAEQPEVNPLLEGGENLQSTNLETTNVEQPEQVVVPETPVEPVVEEQVQPEIAAEEPPVVEAEPEVPVVEEPVAVEPPVDVAPTPEQVAQPAVVPVQEQQQPEMPIKPKKSGAGFFIVFVAILFGMIALAYAFVLWNLVQGSFTSPQFAQFLSMVGMEPSELKEKFTWVTHGLFGGISFIFLIATLVKFFQWVMAPADSINKKPYLKKMGGFLFSLFLFIGIWVGLIWLISQTSADQPQAVAKSEALIKTTPVNVVGLTAPITVEFDLGTALFQKIPEEYVKEIYWDFDSDGQFDDASGPKVSHRFLDRGINNGRFPITVKVNYFSPSVNAEKEYTETIDVIVFNVEVDAKMSAVPEAGSVPLAVKFSAADSVDADGAIILYEWDLDDDGEYEVRGPDAVEAEKTFYQIGDHIVRLRVTGANNDFAVVEKTISTVAAEEKVRAEITSPNSDFEGMAPLSVTFSGDTSYTKTGKIVSYFWKVIGEDKDYQGRTMQRVFDVPGEYEVELIVENEEGNRDRMVQMVNVYARRDMKIITSPAVDSESGVVTGKVPFEVVFDASKSEIPKAVDWQWDFEGDGIVDEYAKKTHFIYREPGTYNAELIIVDADDNEFRTSQKIVVENLGVVAKIAALPPSGSVPLTVEFDGSGSTSTEGQIIDYIWTFPGEEPIHYSGKIKREFKEVGVFPVMMTALTEQGAEGTDEIMISVRGQELSAEFVPTPAVGTVPLDVKFSPRGSTGNIRSYYWEFGDGAISVDAFPTHKFTYPGEFPVKLKLTDARGLISETTKVIKVEAAPEAE